MLVQCKKQIKGRDDYGDKVLRQCKTKTKNKSGYCTIHCPEEKKRETDRSIRLETDWAIDKFVAISISCELEKNHPEIYKKLKNKVIKDGEDKIEKIKSRVVKRHAINAE